MKTAEFITKYGPCRPGQNFAERFDNMSAVWLACERPVWLFWILENYSPLTKSQGAELARGFAESVSHLVGSRPQIVASYAAAAATYATNAAAAKATDEYSAKNAEYAAANAKAAIAYAAISYSADAHAAQCDFIRATIPNPF